MATEYDPKKGARPVPEDLEHKSTVQSVAPQGYKNSPIPHVTRTGSDLTTAEKTRSNKVPGTLMQSDGTAVPPPTP